VSFGSSWFCCWAEALDVLNCAPLVAALCAGWRASHAKKK
jgi:hypothetical protein